MTVSFHKFGEYFPGTGDVKDVGESVILMESAFCWQRLPPSSVLLYLVPDMHLSSEGGDIGHGLTCISSECTCSRLSFQAWGRERTTP